MMFREVDRGVERQTGMSGNMPQGHVQCFISAFKRKNLLACAICILITLVEHFSGGKEFDSELRTRLLASVDNPPLSVVVRMDVRVGEFHYVRVAQARKGAEDEGIPVNACSVIGELDIHHGLQFRCREVATFRVFRFDIEPRERIDGNQAVFIRRVGHQLQFLDRSGNAARKHISNTGKIGNENPDSVS